MNGAELGLSYSTKLRCIDERSVVLDTVSTHLVDFIETRSLTWLLSTWTEERRYRMSTERRTKMLDIDIKKIDMGKFKIPGVRD